MATRRTPRLSLDLLRGFRAAAHHLSFTNAARELFITQSAISQEVKALEDQLGTPLFIRVNRTLRLTQAGEQLYRAADEALALIDAAAAELTGAGRTLSVTTTVPLASLWLSPRLPEFVRAHPDIDLRVAASNDNVDIVREHIDVAIRFAPTGAAPPSPQKLFDYDVFPVCSPALAQDRDRPIRTPADLAKHVRLEFETIRSGRPWFDWPQWLHAMGIRDSRCAGSLCFSHYDQVIEAAIAGSGVAIGKWPYLARQLEEGTLVAPFGESGKATLGSYYIVLAPAMTQRSSVTSFVAWLQRQVQLDAGRRNEARSRRTAAPAKTTRRSARSLRQANVSE